MTAESDDDRAAFVDPDDFGEAVVYRQDGVDIANFDAVFQRQSVEGLADYGGGVTHRVSTLTCRDSDLPADADEGDTLSVRGLDFTVRTIEPDGTGMTVLRLERV